MGSIRLLLAIAVLLSHVDIRIAGLNPGVMAVIGFYLISGYVMTGLINRHYAALSQAPRFYLDRLLRLYPQYLFIAILVLVWQAVSGARTLFLQRPPDWMDLVNNLLIIPMNFFMWNGTDQYALIPPSWSLGAEMQFYLLAPLIILFPTVAWLIGLASLGVQGLAWLGLLHPEWFGYRLAPGVLCFFIYGVLMYRLMHKPLGDRWVAAPLLLAIAAPFCAALVLLWLRAKGLHAVPYHQEVLIGFGFGGLLLFLGAKFKFASWDARLGDLAYGVFVNHFFLIWLFWSGSFSGGWPAGFGLVAASLFLAFLGHRFLEQPLHPLRHRLRRVSKDSPTGC
jgi:peptidoglycan/LPS O-acetylase OafA/YrhL